MSKLFWVYIFIFSYTIRCVFRRLPDHGSYSDEEGDVHHWRPQKYTEAFSDRIELPHLIIINFMLINISFILMIRNKNIKFNHK